MMNNETTSLAQLNASQPQTVCSIRISDDLQVCPAQVFEHSETLERLDLSNNQIHTLPDEFACLKKLRILFLSDNQFTCVPEILAQCPNLSMIGFKANRIDTVPENALPLTTRWLILTDNRIAQLPNSIGDLAQLQKCMLAGNQLTELPSTLVNCQRLQLLRISANKLSAFPVVLHQLDQLAWLAFSGNPFCDKTPNVSAGISRSDTQGSNAQGSRAQSVEVPSVNSSDVVLHQELGRGASGIIYRGTWAEGLSKALPDNLSSHQDIAIKVFKGSVTSDGYPEDELQACLRVGQYKNMVNTIAYIDDEYQAIVMEMIPSDFTNLGKPPSLESCTRDIFDESAGLPFPHVLDVFYGLANAVIHLHSKGVSHGDIYAHNVLIDHQANALFSDYGAASLLPCLSDESQRCVKTAEARALGFLLEDLLRLVDQHESRVNQPKIDAMQGIMRGRLDELKHQLINQSHDAEYEPLPKLIDNYFVA